MYAIFVLYLVHDKRTLQRCQVLYSSQYIEHKLLIVFHVRRMYLEQIIEASRYIITLGHLGNVAYNLGEVVRYLTAEATHLDIAKDNEASVKLLRIEHGYVFLNVAVCLQTFKTLKDGRRGETDTRSQLFRRQSGVLLQSAQNLQIYLV